MQKINSFTILKVTVCGFKCFKDETSFDFGDMTYVKGANGLGKSSIADAIAFAFTGASFFGEKGLDKLHNSVHLPLANAAPAERPDFFPVHPDCPEMWVSVRFVDENGEIHSLTRTRKKDTTTIAFDAYNLRQTDMNEIFGERDLFLSMFNPTYFIDTLGADGKEMLERMLPFVSPEAVIEALSEPLKSEMKGETMLSPETYIKNTRAEIRDLESKRVYLQGQSDLHEAEAVKARDTVEEITGEILGLGTKISVLESERDAGYLTADETERLTELYRRRDELASDKDEDSADNQLLRDIQQKEVELAALTAAVYQPSFTVQIAEKDAELKSLYKEYDSLSGIIKELQPGFKCPSCFLEITEDNISAAKGSLQKRLNVCVEAGQKAKKELIFLQNRESDAQKAFEEKTANDAALLENQIDSLRERYQADAADRVFADNERAEEIKNTNGEIQHMEDRKINGNLSFEQQQELSRLYEKKRELELQLEMYKDVLEKPGFKDQIADTEKEIGALKVKVSNEVQYIGTKNKLLFNSLNLNRVEFSLQDIVKSTGEIKDVFRFSYNGREYRRLSLSEKIRAGLEVAELIKRLSGRNYPTFIDNAESICAIDNVKPTSQLIFALVERGKALSVTQKVMHRVEAQTCPKGAASAEGECAEQALRKAG